MHTKRSHEAWRHEGAPLPWCPELSFWGNHFKSKLRLSSILFVSCGVVCFFNLSLAPTAWSARCRGAPPALDAAGALLEDVWGVTKIAQVNRTLIITVINLGGSVRLNWVMGLNVQSKRFLMNKIPFSALNLVTEETWQRDGEVNIC